MLAYPECDDEQPTPKETLIEISMETTYLTEPLDDEGFDDTYAPSS